MNILQLKKLLLANAPLAVISIILGYSFWYIASYDQTITLQTHVPLCFSDTKNNYSINAPEQLQIVLKGKRSALLTLDNEFLAVHINTAELSPGTHGITIADQHLFLPKSINLVHYKPSNLTITISEKNNL